MSNLLLKRSFINIRGIQLRRTFVMTDMNVNKLNLSIYSSNLALKLDAEDGNVDNKISASIWNNFVKDKGGKEIKSFITVDKAVKSISTYMYNLHSTKKVSVDDVNKEWGKPFILPTPDGTPIDKIVETECELTDAQKKFGIKKIVERKDSTEVVDKVYYYTDGKVIREFKDENRGLIKDTIKYPKNMKSIIPQLDENDMSPKPIEIKLPEKYSDEMVALLQKVGRYSAVDDEMHTLFNEKQISVIKNAQKFAKTLEESKASLMRNLNLDNKTYDMYAKLAIGIAERETGFGNRCIDDNTGLKYLVQGIALSIKKWRNYRANTSQKSPIGNAKKENDALSVGLTQIKYDNIINSAKNADDKFHNINKNIVDLFNKYGINDAKDLYDAEKCALATMIVLSTQIEKTEIDLREEHSYRNEASKALGYDGLPKVKSSIDAKIVASESYRGDGRKVASNLTIEDVILHSWHTSRVPLQDGCFVTDVKDDYYKAVKRFIDSTTFSSK